MDRYSDKDRRAIVADERRWCEHGSTYGTCSKCETACPDLARELLARRKRERRLERALRELFRMCEEHRAKETKYVTCGWFGDAEALIARALGSRPPAKATAKGKARRG